MPRINSISLSDFTRLAERAPDARAGTTYIKMSGGRLDTSGWLGTAVTWTSTKRATIEAFVGALRERFGSRIADLVAAGQLRALHQAGRSLTARAVKNAVAQAVDEQNKEAVNTKNKEAAEKFLVKAPGDSGCNLEDAVGKLCAKEGFTPEEQKMLYSRLAKNILVKAEQGGFFPEKLTPELLHDFVSNRTGRLVNVCSENELQAIQKSQTLPGTLKQRLELADLGLGSLSFSRAVAELGDIRRLQAEKLADAHRLQELKTTPLTPAAVYEGLFKEPPPPHLRTNGQIIAEIDARCDREKAELLGRVGPRGLAQAERTINSNVTMVPWARLASLAERPDIVTLADVPHVAKLITGRKDPAEVEKRLLSDPRRVHTSVMDSGNNKLEVPAAYSFNFPGAETQTIRVGKDTDFFGEPPGTPEANLPPDKKAYLATQENSLTESLKTLCREVCGGEGANEAQVTGAMFCLTQAPKASLFTSSSLAGVGFTEHSSVSVSLSRQPDGSVKADFSSSEDQRVKDALGHFKMSLSIAPDGRITVTEYQITPRREVLEARANEAIRDRCTIDASPRSLQDLGKLVGLGPEGLTPEKIYEKHFNKAPQPGLSPGEMTDAVNNSLHDIENNRKPDGLTAQIQARARALAPEANVVGRMWKEIDDVIKGRLKEEAARLSPAPLTAPEILKVREQVLDEYFGAPGQPGRLQEAAERIPEAQRPAFVRGALELGLIPDQALMPPPPPSAKELAEAAEQGQVHEDLSRIEYANAVNQSFIMKTAENAKLALEAVLTAEDRKDAVAAMSSFNRKIIESLSDNPAFQRKGTDFFVPGIYLGLRMALGDLLGRVSPEALARNLNQPGPFRDMLYEVNRTGGLLSDEERAIRSSAESVSAWFLASLSNLLPDDTIHALNDARERDLSLPSQRAIMGANVHAARGAEKVGALKDLDETLPADMPAFKRAITRSVEQDLVEGPGGSAESRAQRTAAGLSHQFSEDYKRDGMIVNGRLYHPVFTGTSEQDFVRLFPDAHTAGLLSNVATQALHGTFFQALGETEGTKTGDIFIKHAYSDMALQGSQHVEQNFRIDTLNERQGLYRVSGCHTRISNQPDSALERYMFEVSVIVALGEPDPVRGGGPRPLPKVVDARMDLLVRGREEAPEK